MPASKPAAKLIQREDDNEDVHHQQAGCLSAKQDRNRSSSITASAAGSQWSTPTVTIDEVYGPIPSGHR